MSNYKPLPELIDSELVARAAAFGTAQLCDGMKGLGIDRDGCMDYDADYTGCKNGRNCLHS